MSSNNSGDSVAATAGSQTNKTISDPAPENSTSDALTTEFQYYGGAIRNLALAITDPAERARAVLWVNKLFGAEYHVEVLRDKRNRYLAALTVSMINDELIGAFADSPPTGTLKDLTRMEILNAPTAEWEKDTTWIDFVSTLPDNCKEISCSFHAEGETCRQASVDMGQQLDNEFLFLLYQIRPYAALMPCSDSRTKVAAWIQTLCRLGCSACDKMRALRNDYAYALYGYVQDLRVAGPFQDYPPKEDYLPSLCEAAKIAAKKHPLTSPYSEEANSFLEVQPNLEDGAFCYIAITGEFVNPDALLPP